jgi:DNA-binding response OmpR family regulator
MRVLLLEDDAVLSLEVKKYLSNHQFECDAVYDGELFLKFVKQKTYDIYVLDVNVPKINGIDVCKFIRKEDISTPILMLTAFEAISDKIEAFEAGADDYLVKPFHFEELIARLKVLFRRSDQPQNQSNIYKVSDLIVNIDRKEVSRGDVKIELTPKEFKLLCILIENQDRVLSKQEISEMLWDYHIETSINTIEVYINFLRKKIDFLSEEKLIHTKVGFGYYLQSN